SGCGSLRPPPLATRAARAARPRTISARRPFRRGSVLQRSPGHFTRLVAAADDLPPAGRSSPRSSMGPPAHLGRSVVLRSGSAGRSSASLLVRGGLPHELEELLHPLQEALAHVHQDLEEDVLVVDLLLRDHVLEDRLLPVDLAQRGLLRQLVGVVLLHLRLLRLLRGALRRLRLLPLLLLEDGLLRLRAAGGVGLVRGGGLLRLGAGGVGLVRGGGLLRLLRLLRRAEGVALGEALAAGERAVAPEVAPVRLRLLARLVPAAARHRLTLRAGPDPMRRQTPGGQAAACSNSGHRGTPRIGGGWKMASECCAR